MTTEAQGRRAGVAGFGPGSGLGPSPGSGAADR